MYTVDKKIFNGVLRKKFNAFVRNSCETIESLMKEDLDKTISEKLIKEAIKKYAYNSMRDIEEQIDAFSKGIKINVKLKRPTSK